MFRSEIIQFLLNETEVPDKGKTLSVFLLASVLTQQLIYDVLRLDFSTLLEKHLEFLVSCQGTESLPSFFFSQRSLVNIQKDFINHI